MTLVQDAKHRLRAGAPWSQVLEELEREASIVEGKEARAAALFALGELCEGGQGGMGPPRSATH